MNNPAAIYEAILATMLAVTFAVSVVMVVRSEIAAHRRARAYRAAMAAPEVVAANDACRIAWATVNARRLPDGRARVQDIDVWDEACQLRYQLHARARRIANAAR